MTTLRTAETTAAIAAAHNELAAAYSEGLLEVAQPVDDNLWLLATKVATVALRTSARVAGTEGFYSIIIPADII